MIRRAARSLYYPIRHSSAWAADRVTHWCDQQTRVTYAIRPALLQRIVRRLLLTTGSLARIVTLFPRVDVKLIAGREWRIAYLGDRILFPELVETLFPDGATIESLGRIPAWRVPDHATEWLDRADLVVCGLPERWPSAWQPRAPWRWRSPAFVQMVTELSGSTLDRWSRGRAHKRLRRDLLVAERIPFVARSTRSYDDLVRFHDQIYLPHIRNRHGDRALTSTPQAQWRDWIARGGELLLLELDGRAAAGVIVADFGTTRFLGEEGISPHLSGTAAGRSVQVALKAHAFDGAFSRRLRRVDLGRSLARRSDPGLRHKRRWRARPELPERSYYPLWTFLGKTIAAPLAQHLDSLSLLDYDDLERVLLFRDENCSALAKRAATIVASMDE